MQTTVGTLKWLATLSILSMSCIPDNVGSVTINTRFTPEIAAMTGQPIPGRAIYDYQIFIGFVSQDPCIISYQGNQFA